MLHKLSWFVLLAELLLVIVAVSCSDSNPSNSQDVPFAVQATAPPDGCIRVANTDSVVIEFTTVPDDGSISTASILFNPPINGAWHCAGNSAVFVPDTCTLCGTFYTVTVTNQVKSASGKPLEQEFSWQFATRYPPVPAPPQRLLFGVEFINWAWGYQHRGGFIDSTGRVYEFDYDEADSMWTVSQDHLVTPNEVDRMFALATRTSRYVMADELLAKYHLICQVARGQYSPPVQTAADAGMLTTIAYEWDPIQQAYRIIDLVAEGDFSYRNLTSEAVELDTFIRDNCMP